MKAGNFYRPAHEFIIFATAGKSLQQFAASETDIWRVRCVNYTKKRLHSAQKPVELFERMITNSSRADDTVLDCFMGSGTTGVACINTGRNFIGFEIDEGFYKIAKERIEEALAKKQQELF